MTARTTNHGWRLPLIAGFVVALIALGVPFATQAQSQPVQHGITFLKGCDSPTTVGEKTSCDFQIVNDFDPDTLTISSLKDVVQAAGGDDDAGNILPQLDLAFSGGSSCNAGNVVCTLPPGSSISTATPFEYHTVTGNDADNANPLVDNADLTWQDLCTSEAPNCPVGNQSQTTGSQTFIQKLPSTVDTLIHDAGHNVVTAVEAGTTVHDQVTVTGVANQPTPTGNVRVDWFLNGTCAGSPQSSSSQTALNQAGVADVTSFTKTPSAGFFAFSAHYFGDSNYQASDGPCEPLNVVDAAIKISPDATNEVNDNHTFTVTVTQNLGDGNGFQPAAGKPVSFTLTDTDGATHQVNDALSSCNGTTDGSGECTIVFTSSTGGTVTGNASVSLVLQGVTVNRDTNPATITPSGPGGSGPAVKVFVDAQISITPSATNEVGAPHTFTVTLEKDLGQGGGMVPAANEHVDFTLTDTNGASHALNAAASTCDNAGPNTDAAGQCTIVFSSPTAGKVTGNASATLVIGTVTLTRDTNPGTATGSGPGGTGPAVKTFVDANITITPATATNEVGDAHTFIVTVQKNVGDGAGFVAAPGEHVSFTLTNSNGAASVLDAAASTCDNAGPNTNAQGQCTIVFTSDSAGKVTGNASVTVTVGGVQMARDTNPATATTAGPGGSGPAVKTFVDASIGLLPLVATNEVGDPHTVTVTVKKDVGNGGGFVPAAGEHVDVTVTDSNGAAANIDDAASTCDDPGPNTDADGQCTVVFTSATAGVVTTNASVTLTIGTVSLTRSTTGNSGPGGSGPAVKRFVDANIRIAPNATNEVGDPHTFTVTVKKNVGDGEGFVPADDEDVDFTLTDLGGAAHILDADASTCDDEPTDSDGECTIVFTSNSAGSVRGNASVTLTINGVNVTRATNGNSGPGGSGPALKTFVDANITITPPTATNAVTDAHTMTVTVQKNEGAGFEAAADEHVDFTLTDSNGAVSQVDADASTCDDAGANTDSNGQCTIVFTSNDSGLVTGNASVTLTIDGISLTRDTSGDSGPGGSGPATKAFVNANISIAPDGVNEVGDTHTFTVTVMKDLGDGSGFVPAAGEHVDFGLTDGAGAASTVDAAASTCDDAGPNTDAAGQCTIVFTSPSSGVTFGNAEVTVTIDGVILTRDTSGETPNIPSGPGGSGPATKRWVDANITIGPDGRNLVGDPHTFTVTVMKDTGTGDGFVPATGEHVDFSLTDTDGAQHAVDTASSTCDDDGANVDDQGQCTIVFTSPTVGHTIGNAAVTVQIGGLEVRRDTAPDSAPSSGPGGSGPANKEWFENPPPELPRTGTDTFRYFDIAILLVLAGLGFVGAGWFFRPVGAHATRPWRRRD